MTHYNYSYYRDPIEEYEYTLKDFVFSKNKPTYENEYNSVLELKNVRKQLLNWGTPNAEIETVLNDPITEKLWNQYLIPTQLNECINVIHEKVIITDENYYDSMNLLFGEWYRLFESKLIETYPRYKKLITLYNENENNLMNKLESIVTSKSRNNELPQTSPNDPYDEKYANNSNVGEVISQSDSNDIVQKLAQVRTMWYNLYKEWVDEFDSLFIEY